MRGVNPPAAAPDPEPSASTPTDRPAEGPSDDGLALVMSGGGARGAYQVGFLRAVAEQVPSFDPPILTGVSAGAINAAFLGSHAGTFATRVGQLEQLWRDLRADDVMDASTLKVWQIALGFGLRLLSGGLITTKERRSLLDTSPLRAFLCRVLDAPDGRLPGVARNIESGRLRALALTASSYTDGGTVTFCEGRDVELWRRPLRRSRKVDLTVDHVMASSALPFFFPAVKLDEGTRDAAWYGDGGIRLTAPLAPAVHLGATRILAISTRSNEELPKGGHPVEEAIPYPPPSQIGSALMNAMFLDQFDGDALRMERVNRLVAKIPPDDRGDLREIGLKVFRPSQDLGAMANEYEARLPKNLRFLTRGTGTLETRNNDFLSLIMFQTDYVSRLVELGHADALQQSDEIAAFLG
ncbi:Patatin-like phospholipase [Planctomycetes bacterium Pla163]|uniref:Patatin-like phospholipase n=1 Tax=Rohdeia mirabilis TaxID=2528008 RepID=A0A518D4Y9_9BACT|nr:Patatin-like phospholipase [Planctomycetes bacterium Pla163]